VRFGVIFVISYPRVTYGVCLFVFRRVLLCADLSSAHPYEEPAYEVYKLEDF
jgi:hypothetical protein